MDTLASLQDFVVTRVLADSPVTKYVAILGRFEGKDGDAVLLLFRNHFSLDKLQDMTQGMTLTLDNHNDVYTKYAAAVFGPHAEVSATLIYPATADHIQRYSTQKYTMVEETPELFNSVVEPHIQSFPASRLQWVYNILDHQKEVERIVFEDPDDTTGFVLLPDLKWDRTQIDQLYCQAIVRDRSIPSLRHLTAKHLPLLRNILAQGTAAIKEHYGVSSDLLRVYIHYQPSYYHLHVHFTHLGNQDTFSVAAGKAHLLPEVISNIEICGDFYQRRTMWYTLGDNDKLLARIRAALAQSSGGNDSSGQEADAKRAKVEDMAA